MEIATEMMMKKMKRMNMRKKNTKMERMKENAIIVGKMEDNS